jgi:hypothetical protein
VLEATLALRERHDPRGSLVFLRKYLQQYPTGALIEESMALAMEAMAALDDGAAGQIGSDYLQRYPSGRFGALAKTAVRRFGR